MKNVKTKKVKIENTGASHVTTGNVFSDLGFSHEVALALKIKTDCHNAILAIVEKYRYTQRDLQKILDQPQPRISELLNGKISKLSLEKLLEYLERLGAKPKLEVKVKEVPRVYAQTHIAVAS